MKIELDGTTTMPPPPPTKGNWLNEEATSPRSLGVPIFRVPL